MPNFEIDSRKIIASKFIAVFSSFIMSFFTVYAFSGIFFLVNKNILLFLLLCLIILEKA